MSKCVVYFGGDLAKQISERIVEVGVNQGLSIEFSEMDKIKKTDFKEGSVGIFVIQVRILNYRKTRVACKQIHIFLYSLIFI
jgi:hypothetical protein